MLAHFDAAAELGPGPALIALRVTIGLPVTLSDMLEGMLMP